MSGKQSIQYTYETHMWNSINTTIPYPGNNISIAHTGPGCIFFDSWRPRWSNGCPPSTVTEAKLFPSPQF